MVQQVFGLLDASKPSVSDLHAVVTSLTSGKVPDGGYALVHLVRWRDRQVARQRWLVYRRTNEDGSGWSVSDATGSRLFGTRQFTLITLHEGAPQGVQYTVDVLRKEADQVGSLRALFQIAASVIALAGNEWKFAVTPIAVQSVPSDIVTHLTIPSKPGATDGDASEVSKQTFDNEGLSHWNVSVGIPTARVNQLEYNAADGTVRTKQVDKQGLVGMLNLSFVPMDTKNMRRQLIPSLVLGAGISSRPLDRLVVGLASGVSLAQVFAGVQFTRTQVPDSLRLGNAATPAQLAENLRAKYEPAFTFGLVFPTRQILERLTAKK
ncbi:MAG: hypothetical protein IT355_02305 [Gemmatimonadaceae bacterium]|nr:hypothetical protein [Gemmatimonadaceae bacterium]